MNADGNGAHYNRCFLSSIAWLILLAVAIVTLGSAQLRSQDVARPSESGLTRPGLAEPPLLSREAAEQGVGQRLREMKERHVQHRLLRRQQSPRDYSVPVPPLGASVPARPDAPDGEIALQRLGGGR